MKRTRLVINIWFVLTCSSAFAQDEKTEVAVFAGGYFNSGFQSFKVLNPSTGVQVGTFKPVTEANSGIFGLRSSYRFMPTTNWRSLRFDIRSSYCNERLPNPN